VNVVPLVLVVILSNFLAVNTIFVLKQYDGVVLAKFAVVPFAKAVAVIGAIHADRLG
jgi:hypothetical protein